MISTERARKFLLIQVAIAGILFLVVLAQAIGRTVDWDRTEVDAVWISWLAVGLCIVSIICSLIVRRSPELTGRTAKSWTAVNFLLLTAVFFWAMALFLYWSWD